MKIGMEITGIIQRNGKEFKITDEKGEPKTSKGMFSYVKSPEGHGNQKLLLLAEASTKFQACPVVEYESDQYTLVTCTPIFHGSNLLYHRAILEKEGVSCIATETD